VLGIAFLLAGVSGLITRLARVVPPEVAGGIQLGLGISLAGLGLRLLQEQLWLGLVVSLVTLLLLGNRRLPAALAALAIGIALAQLTGTGAPWPQLTLGLHLPVFAWPSGEDIIQGTQLAVIPQIPLTLTNAVIVTAAVTRDLLPQRAGRVTERNLAITTGLGNLLAAPFGGYPMCHGAGGIAGHYRFGARTATAPLLIGLACVAMGVLLGDGAIALLALVPAAVLGSLLFSSGIELALAASPQRYAGEAWAVALVIAVISVTASPAVAFVIGWALAVAVRRGAIHL
jgi:SulP family sulfate permease